jgi:hypothetical protein
VTADTARWYRDPLVILLVLILVITVAAVVALTLVNRSRPVVSEPFPTTGDLSREARELSPAAARLAVLDEPDLRVPWTMMLRPEDGIDGEELVFSGTMPAPAGVSPNQEITMLVTYTEDPEEMQEWLDETGAIRPPRGMRVASEVRYYVSAAGGEEWGVQIDLVPDESGPVIIGL